MTDFTDYAQITAQAEDARKAARRLFGADYDARVAVWRGHVRESAAFFRCPVLQVPLYLYKHGQMPDNPLLLLAAVADEIEAQT